jgi:hypothetical protein
MFLILTLSAAPFWLGCSGGNGPVKPAEAEKVPAEAPVGEEQPSTDEK